MNTFSSPSTAEDTEASFDVDAIVEQLTSVKYEEVHTLVKLDL